MDYAALAPEYVRSIAPYVPGKPISEVARELGMPEASIVKLASNENPRAPSARVREAVVRALDELTRYPDGNGFELKAALSRRLGVAPEQIVIGNGSNDVLEMVAQGFLRPGDHAVYAEHAFAVYPLATQARGARGIVAPARDFGHDLEAMRGAITPQTRVIFVANPNNPTGTWLPPDAVRAFVAAVPENVLVVLDEAYNEYLSPELRHPSIDWVLRMPNLLLSRSFSKAYGLAGLRVGYGVAQPELTDLLNRVRQPFNCNALAQAAAAAALGDEAFVERSVEVNRKGMAQLTKAFDALALRYLPSFGNFLLVQVGDGAAVYQGLLKRGVIVRPVANYGLPQWLRVTIGLPEENDRFIAALREVLPGSHA